MTPEKMQIMQDALHELDTMDEYATVSAMFNTMRILKPLFPADTFYETYKGMYKKYQPFFDTYMLIWNIGAKVAPKRILEIGCRTGISICQLLCAHMDVTAVEKVVLIDPFSDGFGGPHVVLKNLQWLNLPYDQRVDIKVAKSQDVLPALTEAGETFDYILVDGDHAATTAHFDLEAVVPLCEEGGIIVFDDISTSPGECGLISVWSGFAERHSDEFAFTHRMEGKGVAWCLKITKEENE